MKDCREAEGLLQDYLDGYLLLGQREELEEHLRGCAACRLLIARMGRLEASLGSLGADDVEPPSGLGERIMAGLPERRDRRRPFRSVGPALAAAAMLLVGLFLGFRAGEGPGAGTREVEVVFHAPDAATVSLVGDFNGWNPSRNVMVMGVEDDLWRARVKLPPGVYEYGFIIDGEKWSKDPLAKANLDDGYGGENSLLFVEG